MRTLSSWTSSTRVCRVGVLPMRRVGVVSMLVSIEAAAVSLNDSLRAGALERCRQTVAKGFNRLSYTEAIALLQQHISDKKVVFENMDVKWGMDLDSEHEKCARCCPVLRHAVPCCNLLSCVATCCHEIGI